MKDSTRIVIVLDRSGSMQSARESTIKGLNTFIAEQKKVSGDVSLKLIQFDDFLGKLSYEVTYNSSLSSAPTFTQNDFEPRGGTPLLDAQGKTITELGEELASLPESERPNKVIVVTITDGYENASKKFTREKISEMIKHQTDKYNWDFVYIGANQDAIAVGTTLGYNASKSMTYNVCDPLAVGATYTNLSSYTTRARKYASGQHLNSNSFTEEERSSSVKGNK